MSAFEILITRQGWLGANDPDLGYDPAPVDLCSHGGIRLTIGGRLIAVGEDDDEYGISESELALLRTLKSDHSPKRPVAERLIFHGCGNILMMGCPVGIDWSAEQAKAPFDRIVKEFADDFEQQQYEDFWKEFEARLHRATR